MLGDSFATGWGVEQEETLASLLALDPRLAVRDLSMSSYGTVRELFVLRRHASGARVVVLWYCPNDVAENREFLLDPRAFVAHAAHRRAEFESLRRSQTEPGRIRSALRTLLASASSGLVGTWRALALPQRRRPATPPTVLADEARLFAAVLAQFRATLAGRDVIVFDLHARRVREGMDDAMRVALARVGSPRVRVVELEGVLDMEDYFHLDEHLTAGGHAALARRLIEGLDQIEALEGAVLTAGLSIPVERGTKLGAFVESGAVRGR